MNHFHFLSLLLSGDATFLFILLPFIYISKALFVIVIMLAFALCHPTGNIRSLTFLFLVLWYLFPIYSSISISIFPVVSFLLCLPFLQLHQLLLLIHCATTDLLCYPLPSCNISFLIIYKSLLSTRMGCFCWIYWLQKYNILYILISYVWCFFPVIGMHGLFNNTLVSHRIL